MCVYYGNTSVVSNDETTCHYNIFDKHRTALFLL